ncbi:MAG TPA: hypothetical protein VGC35_12710 [Allosphingosinicella sp.]
MAIPAEGYIFAALVAASAAFIGIVIGKEQKTTEFRQDWINAQRTDLALIISLSEYAANQENHASTLKKFDEAYARVRLRENPTKPEWIQVIKYVEMLRNAAFVVKRPKDIRGYHDIIVQLSTELLKSEWNRVRRGEKWFVAAKWLIPPAVFLGVCALAYGKGFLQIQL